MELFPLRAETRTRSRSGNSVVANAALSSCVHRGLAPTRIMHMSRRFNATWSPSVLSRTTSFAVEDNADEAIPRRGSDSSSSLRSSSTSTRTALFGRVGAALLWVALLFCLCAVALGQWTRMIDLDPTVALNVFALLSGAIVLVFEICRAVP